MKRLKVLNIAFGALFIICMLAFILTGSDGVCGYTARIVVSGSMEPTIPVYTVNIVKKCDISDIDNGDIILYRYKSDIIHRVVDVDIRGTEIILTTQGDANNSPDLIDITPDMVIGKVVKTLFWTRYILEPVKGGNRTSIQIFIVICILAIYIIYLLVKRYAKIYYIYVHTDIGNNSCKRKSIKERYTDNKNRWKKAEIKYRTKDTIEENKAVDDKEEQ